jgi:hypothetical protein
MPDKDDKKMREELDQWTGLGSIPVKPLVGPETKKPEPDKTKAYNPHVGSDHFKWPPICPHCLIDLADHIGDLVAPTFDTVCPDCSTELSLEWDHTYNEEDDGDELWFLVGLEVA